MKKLAIGILVVIVFNLLVNVALAGDVETLKAEDAILVKRIQGYNRLIAQSNIRRAEIQGILKWLAQKEKEAAAEKTLEEKQEEKADAPSTTK